MLKNELFYSYVDDFEKEFMSMESSFDIEMAKLQLACEYADRLYEIRLMESNAHVLNESGTYEDIAVLYEDAGKENVEKKDGIIKNIIRSISNFITGIFDKISKFFSKEKEVQLEEAEKSGRFNNIKLPNINTCISKLQDAVNTVDRFLKPAYTVTNEQGEQVFDAVQTAINAFSAIGIVQTSIKIYHKAYSVVTGLMDTVKKKLDQLEKGEIKGEGAKKALTAVQSLVKVFSNISSAAVKVFNDIVAKFTGGKSDKNAEVQVEDKDAENSTEEKSAETKKTEESVSDFLEDTELMEACDDILDMIDNL